MDMNVLLQAMIVVFMLFLCALCLFAVVVIARDIIYENARRRERIEAQSKPNAVTNEHAPVEAAEKPQPAPQPEPQPAPQPAPVEAPVETKAEAKVEEVAVTAEPLEAPVEADLADEDPNSVAFSRNTLTMEERYMTLSTEFKRYFDDIVNHTLQKPGVKETKKTSAYDYKIGYQRVIKISIRRSEIVCEFNFIDKDFDQYANASDVKIKRAATVVRVSEPSAVGVVKDGIDLVCTQIEELKEQKKELAKEKRRQRRQAAKENADNQ
ncbi:MAG: hypothetical protein IKL77_00375 [Clostridia bacterium]|nr:hypothetical protein [Clostridia bacterium]